MTDDEVAYIEVKGWKASFVPELSIIHHFANFCGSNACALRSAMPDADFLQNLHLCPLLGVVRTRFAQRRFRPVFQPFFSVVGRCGATRVRSDSSRNDLRLRSLDGAFSSPCCKTGTFCARGQRAIASADGQALKLRPPQCQGSPEHEFSRNIKAKRPVDVQTE